MSRSVLWVVSVASASASASGLGSGLVANLGLGSTLDLEMMLGPDIQSSWLADGSAKRNGLGWLIQDSLRVAGNMNKFWAADTLFDSLPGWTPALGNGSLSGLEVDCRVWNLLSAGCSLLQGANRRGSKAAECSAVTLRGTHCRSLVMHS